MAAGLFGVTVEMPELQARLDKWRRAGGDASPIMRVVAESFVAEMSDVFDSQGYGKWAPLAVTTIRMRRKKGAGAKILQDTGRLAGSFQGRSGKDFAEVTTDVKYARFHVEGTTHAPRRDFTNFDERVFDEARDMVTEWVTEQGA